jgi:hypothetical protein
VSVTPCANKYDISSKNNWTHLEKIVLVLDTVTASQIGCLGVDCKLVQRDGVLYNR